jgi:hypothetical protein
MSGTAARREALATRRAQSLEMHRAGATMDAIAAHFKVNKSTVSRDIQAALAAVLAVPTRDVVAGELDRLDAMLQGLWPQARRGQPAAVDRVLRIMDRRADYLGLNATEHNVVLGTDEQKADTVDDLRAATDAKLRLIR